MMMLVMVIAGAVSYISIPKEADPDIDVPVYFVSVFQQGISPNDAERLLVRPLESKLRGLDGLKELTTVAAQSTAIAVLEFNIESNKDEVLADIRDKVDQAKTEFPADADEPIINETNFALQPTLIVTLSGQVPERALYSFARRLKDEIEAINTVREAKLTGNREEMLEVVLDLARLESYNINQSELLNALSQNNQLIAAGFIDDGKARFNLKVPGLVENARDVYSIPIKQNGEAVVTLGDVAEIRRTFKDPSSYTRVNGEPAVSLEITKRIGTNIIENNKAVRDAVAAFSKDWPSTIKINYLLDKSGFIDEVQGSLQASILTAISLVMVVVVFALGLRSGLLVGLSIPVSFATGFMILGLGGFTVNMMVLFGMVLTVGMLVDGAIVVTEYADRKLAEGMAPGDAYKRAAQLMFWPVVSSTATTLAAFLPLLLWPGVPGEFMSWLPIMVIIVLTASLLTALIFLPTSGALTGRIASWLGNTGSTAAAAVFTSAILGFTVFALADGGFTYGLEQWFGPFSQSITEWWNSGVDADRIRLVEEARNQTDGATGETLLAEIPNEWTFANVLAILLGLAAGLAAYPFVMALLALLERRRRRDESHDEVTLMFSSQRKLEISKVPGLMKTYLRVLQGLSNNIVGNLVVIAAVIGVAFLVFTSFGSNNAGVEFFVDEEPDVAVVLISARGNLSAAKARDLVGEVEAQVLTVKGIRNTVMTANVPGTGGGGGPLDGVQDKPADVVGQMQLEMANYCCRRKAVEIFEEIRQKTASIPGIKVEVRKIEGGPPTGKDLRLQVKSTSYDDMVATVARARGHVDTMAGLQDVEDGRPLPGIEFELTVDRETAGRYNAGIVAVGSMIQLVSNGVLIGKYRPDDSEDELDIRVRLPAAQRTFSTLDELRLPTNQGQVPLSNFVTREPRPKVNSITRKDGLYSMEVKANLIAGFEEGGKAITPDDKTGELQAWLDQQDWPSSVQLKFRGADEEQKESGEFLMKAAGIALFLMFIILVTQFNSFYQTLLTLTTVVLAIVGVLIGLMVTGQKFSIIMTGTGVVALAGIVVNNAIVLIDTFNRLRSEGVETREAVLKTSAQRLRPIMLTTITTILGLLPMALQINMDYFERTIAVGGITSVWWVQLSTAIIFGLAFSTLLTLIVIPSMLAMPANIMAPWKIPAENDYAKQGARSASEEADRYRLFRPKPVFVPGEDAIAKPSPDVRPPPAVPDEESGGATILHPEDASVVPLPKRAAVNDDDNIAYPTAAE